MSDQAELIEKQIEEAANFLAHSKTMKNRDRDMDRAFSALLAASGRLLEIVQNQQGQIEELQKRVSDLEPQTAMGLLDEVVRRGLAGEFYKGEKR